MNRISKFLIDIGSYLCAPVFVVVYGNLNWVTLLFAIITFPLFILGYLMITFAVDILGYKKE